jgi:hypothetical protein
MINFTKEQHIKKHTLKENTYNENCLFCNPDLKNNLHKANIDKDFISDNIKPLDNKKLLATIKEFKKNLKELGLK